jgi:hypothetical protein
MTGGPQGVIGTALSAELGTILVQFIGPLVRDHYERKRRAAYMALRLAVFLEAYAVACADFISEDSEPPIADDEYPNRTTQLPQPPEYPDDPDGWRAIDGPLAGKCLNLPAKIRGSQRVINSEIEHMFYDHLDDTLDEQAAERGLEAWRIAAALRRTYAVEAVETVWDYAGGLEHSLAHVKQKRAESARRKAEATREFPPQPAAVYPGLKKTEDDSVAGRGDE